MNRGGLCHRAGSRPDRSAPASAWSPRRPGRGRLTAFTLARPVAAGTGGPGRVLAGDDPLGMLVAGPQRVRAATSRRNPARRPAITADARPSEPGSAQERHWSHAEEPASARQPELGILHSSPELKTRDSPDAYSVWYRPGPRAGHVTWTALAGGLRCPAGA